LRQTRFAAEFPACSGPRSPAAARQPRPAGA
jgi:hypothetical protein